MDLLKDNLKKLYLRFWIPSLGSTMAMGIWLGVMLGGVVNIVLDIVFVFPVQMGIGGAALASAIGMVIQVLVGTTHFFS